MPSLMDYMGLSTPQFQVPSMVQGYESTPLEYDRLGSLPTMSAPVVPSLQQAMQAPFNFGLTMPQMGGFAPMGQGTIPMGQGTVAVGPQELEAHFQEASKLTGMPVNVLKAVAQAESDFRNLGPNRVGATGIMQTIPSTFAEVSRANPNLGLTNIRDPRQNILAGALYLKQMYNRFGGDMSRTLAAYNAGPGNVAKYGGIPPFRETQNYVSKIMGRLGYGG